MFVLKKLFLFFFILCISTNAYSEIVNSFKIEGNDRVSKETIKMFSGISLNEDITKNKINDVLKNIYNSNFFDDVSISLKDGQLNIIVSEKPLIIDIEYKGIKSNEIRNSIFENRILKPRSSFDDISLKLDEEKILNLLKNSGYYFSNITSYKESMGNNSVNILYDIDLGKKSKIKKISFIGNKIFKDNKLRNIIISEEYKFWKFISGKKFLNQDIIRLDESLLKNYYLNKGFKNVVIYSSYAKLINDDEFELIFNIDANNKVFFNEIDIELPDDFEKNNYSEIYKFFDKIKNKPYSLSQIKKIVSKIELITLNEQYESVDVFVNETINDDKLNLNFKINSSELFTVNRINIFGNNVTQESVIRNELLLDEGDPFNEILFTKSINNIKSLNFFKDVSAEIIDLDDNQKDINIDIQEKPTGEIALGAGAGTSGATVAFGIKENNFLGRGIGLDTSLTLTEKTIRGKFSVLNPNFKNTDRDLRLSIQAIETDRSSAFGYKSNKLGFSTGTSFEYLEDLNLGIDIENFYEKISTDTTASDLQKTQEGNYWDTFLNLDFDLDKRNQKYDTNDGYRAFYSVQIPVVSDTNTLINSLNYRIFSELYENNITTASIMLKSANSISGENVKLSERLFIPSRSLRGFESGKIGPKDGDDYIGGNFVVSANFSSTIPQILPNYEDLNFLFFIDAANIWGVDYSSSIDDNGSLRSSVGLGVDWFTPIGPLNFSFSHPISKKDSDITETFRFNIGTTF